MDRLYIRGSIIGTIISTLLVVLVFLWANPVKVDLTYPTQPPSQLTNVMAPVTAAGGIGASVEHLSNGFPKADDISDSI